MSVHLPPPRKAAAPELAALEAACLGFRVFPVKGGEKRPLVKGWQTLATTDAEQIRKWWARWPDANPAIALHGFIVLDADDPAAVRYLGSLDLPETASVFTPNGWHVYFRGDVPEGCRKQLAPNLDVKGNRGGRATGYVLASGSVVNGRAYRWDQHPRETPIAQAPPELLEQVKHRALEVVERSVVGTTPAVIPMGRRNVELTRLAGRLVNAGVRDEEELYDTLAATNRRRCGHPLPDAEVRRVAASAAQTFDAPPPWWGMPRGVGAWCAANGSTRAERAVLRVLADHADLEGRAWPSYGTLMELTGFGRNSVTAAVNGLEAAGVVMVERRKKHGHRYTLRRHPLRAVVSKKWLFPYPWGTTTRPRGAARPPLRRRAAFCPFALSLLRHRPSTSSPDKDTYKRPQRPQT